MNETTEIEALQRGIDRARDRATVAAAIKEMSEMARQAGFWQGSAEGKDIIIRQLEADRDRLRAALHRIVALAKHAHPFTEEAEYFRISTAALKETDHD